MSEMNCNVIRDLLPLYEDNAVSEDTAQLVRDHLKDCPACREALRRMRVPVSIPPDNEPELLSRFEQRVKRAKRARRIKLLCLAAVAAAVLLLCLWYTRPQPLSRLLDGEITSLSAIWAEATLTVSDNQSIPDVLVFSLPSTQAGQPGADGIIDALESGRYRAHFGNLLGSRSQSGGSGAQGTLSLSLTLDGSRYAALTLTDTDQLTLSGEGGLYTYTANPELYDALSDLVQTYGEPD